ncbi:MAG: Zn-dependent hydrolase [Pedosphaera sp.]|nr:Zn-dependent hydrolase [Pedosphaera sp.]
MYANSYPHPAHGFLDVLRWQLGLGPREASPFAPGDLPPYKPQSCTPEGTRLAHPNPERIQLTWIGHSTFLIQYRGRNILTDPIFGNCGPLPSKRLRRVVAPGLPFRSLPQIHDVLISHCHYDHLDAATIDLLGGGPKYWLPAGLARWFQKRGINHCQQMEWGQSATMAERIEVHCVPAQHFAARSPFDRNRTWWCGWVVRSSDRSIYFAGDTGYCPVFREIGKHFGGFDLAMIPIGAYRPRWLMQPMHVDPREAVQIHLDVHSRQSVACHWGTFALTDEPLNEPPALLARALADQSMPAEQFRVLRFGETVEV